MVLRCFCDVLYKKIRCKQCLQDKRDVILKNGWLQKERGIRGGKGLKGWLLRWKCVTARTAFRDVLGATYLEETSNGISSLKRYEVALVSLFPIACRFNRCSSSHSLHSRQACEISTISDSYLTCCELWQPLAVMRGTHFDAIPLTSWFCSALTAADASQAPLSFLR